MGVQYYLVSSTPDSVHYFSKLTEGAGAPEN